MDPDGPILCLNAGSSSLKFALYRRDAGAERPIAAGNADRIGLDRPGQLTLEGPAGEPLVDRPQTFPDHAAAVQAAFGTIEANGLPAPIGVGHRVVHGGPNHAEPERIDDALVDELRRLVPFAPLHQPGAVRVIEAARARHPDLPQVACFDTAFHRRMPEIAQRLPLPAALWGRGIRRYGFHGLSYESILESLGPDADGRLIIAHLGNGASMAAVHDGNPVDTTMGFTPAGGLMMGTRPGDLDPGLLTYLLERQGYDSTGLDRLIHRESGLLGVSGISPDMRTLLERRDSEPAAAMAVAMFCRIARKHVGALASALGGLDRLVFTAGIGERSAPVRAGICEGLEFLGVAIDPARNEAHADRIGSASGRVDVRVIATTEDRVIARHTRRLIAGGA